MKTKKRNQTGMTLVEVIVAMAIFGVMMTAVTMAFAAAVRFNSRNQRRDQELNLQQTALERNNATGVQVNNGSFKNREIVYYQGTHNDNVAKTYSFTNATDPTVVSALKSVTADAFGGVTEYKAIKSSYNGNLFNFELKEYSGTPYGGSELVHNKDNGEYKISCVNRSDKQVEVRITKNIGFIYLGDYTNGYKHASPLYIASLAPYVDDPAEIASYESLYGAGAGSTVPSSADIGFQTEFLKASSPDFTTLDTYLTDNGTANQILDISVYVNGALDYHFIVDDTMASQLISSTEGTLQIEVSSSGSVNRSII